MHITKKHWVATAIAIVLAVIVGVGVWHYKESRVASFPISVGDTISDWTFKGAYTGNDTLIAQGNADIVHLKGLLGKGEYDDYDLYIGIANDYNLMGDGKAAYEYYNRAIAVHPDKGLAYVDLAHLMDELKAYNTARDVYAKAIAVEPAQLEYHIEQLDYLTRQFPTDQALILAALTNASNQFGDTAAILQIEAQWLADTGKIADAITAWKTVRMLSPASRQSAIDAEIARLSKKL